MSNLGKLCKNCGTVLDGRFCAACGQGADVHVPSAIELVHEALEGLTHSDSRLWRSLKLLVFVPGKLTQEFIAGRRVAYLPPFRLYLVLSVLFFVTASLTAAPDFHLQVSAADTAAQQNGGCRDFKLDGVSDESITRHLQVACEKIASDRGESLLHSVFGLIPKAMFLFLPVIAFLHMLLYWRPRARYAVHWLFFIHLHAFAFLAMTLLALLNAAVNAFGTHAITTLAGSTIALYLPIYVLLAMKRVFARAWLATAARACVLFCVYAGVLALTLGGVFLYALWHL